MRERLVIFFLVTMAMAVTSCGHLQQPMTLSAVKADLDCIPYEKGVSWKQIVATLRDPDLAPLPEPGTDLRKNARIYRDGIIVLYVESQEVTEGGKIRFQEVVTHIDLCREK